MKRLAFFPAEHSVHSVTFLTGVKLVITEGLPAWDHSDDESIRKKNILTYAFLIAPAVAPIVYMWGVL